MRKLIASNLGIEIDFTIYDNRVYMKTNNPMIRSAFVELLKKQNAKQPESNGLYDMFEIEGETEEKIHESLSNMLKQGGFQVQEIK